MNEFINSIAPVEWGLLGIALLALMLSWLALHRASRALKRMNTAPLKVAETQTEEAGPGDERPAVALEVTANKDDRDQVTLVLANSGQLAARQILLSIDAPARIFDSEGLSSGVESADVTSNSVILPRLAILDADNALPVAEILPGKQLALAAVLTMAFGKICDFPISLRWKDGNGTQQHKKVMLTI